MVTFCREEPSNGIWRVVFRQKLLSYLDEETLRIEDEQGRDKGYRETKRQRCS